MPKVGIVSLGCPKNLVDSEVMLGMLARHGFELTPSAAEAEVIVVNTCGFIEPAQRESIDTILEMAELKKTGSAKRLVVAGCLVERFRQEILKDIPEVDFVIGTNELERVIEACASENEAREAEEPVEPYLYHDFTPRVLSTPSYSAYLKIAEGCDHPCTFCVIPRMRGKFRSRRFESVVREAENLARQGVREITIIGQDTTSYGEDLGLKDGLAVLLRQLGKIPELVWTRFLYCYPNRLNDALIAAIAETPKICKYFDVPLQHASGAVLKLMRRGSSGPHFLKLLAKIRHEIPAASIRTSFIAGFPGETEDDFKALLDFVEAAEFDHLGVFLYSNEQSSASFSLPDQVPGRVAKRRQKALLGLQRKISRRKLKRKVGQTYPLLVEGRSEETELLFTGRLEAQAPEIDGRVFINDFEGDEPHPGDFRWATITDSSDYDLVARLEEKSFAPRIIPFQRPAPGPQMIQILPAGTPAMDTGHAVPHL
jgi:ribosomal protein S12 methylthiotransferase